MCKHADSDREKRRLRGKFDLTTAVHKAEYINVKRPLGKKTGKPIEPAHKFEVNLEADNFTKEKSVNIDLIFSHRLRWTDMMFSCNTSYRSTKIQNRVGESLPSNVSSAQASIVSN